MAEALVLALARQSVQHCAMDLLGAHLLGMHDEERVLEGEAAIQAHPSLQMAGRNSAHLLEGVGALAKGVDHHVPDIGILFQ